MGGRDTRRGREGERTWATVLLHGMLKERLASAIPALTNFVHSTRLPSLNRYFDRLIQ